MSDTVVVVVALVIVGFVVGLGWLGEKILSRIENSCAGGHTWGTWQRSYQNYIDTKTKVKTAKSIQERKCKVCNFVERNYI